MTEERHVSTRDRPVVRSRALSGEWVGSGTRLVGDEGYGPTVIEITAVGDKRILARGLSHNGEPTRSPYEGSWVLYCREWSEVQNGT